MPYSAKAIANYFIDLAGRASDKPSPPLTPMKIQKLVYFAHGWSLALTGNPLIDEEVQAWPYGPVIPSLYHEFKEFGNGPITKYATTLIMNNPVDDWAITIPKVDENSAAIPLLNKVWDSYGKYTGVQLSNATHQPNTPWYEIWEKDGRNKKSVGIPDDIIRKHFVAKIKPSSASAPTPVAANGNQ